MGKEDIAAAVDVVANNISESSSFEQPQQQKKPQQQQEYHWKGATEEQQAPSSSPPTASLPKLKTSRAWAATTAAATATATSVELSPSSQPSDEEREDTDTNNTNNSMPPTTAAVASPHPWRRDLAFKQHVNNNKRTPKQQQQQQQQQQRGNGNETVGSSSSSLSRYRTSYRTLLQQRKQVFEHITIQEEGEGEQQKSFTLDEEGDTGDAGENESDEESYNNLQHQPTQTQTQNYYDLDLHIPPLLPTTATATTLRRARASSAAAAAAAAAAAIVPTSFSNRNLNNSNLDYDNRDSDAVSLGMSIQSSVNRNSIRTLLQQEIKVRVQQIYTGDFLCVVGMSETDGQYRKRPKAFGRHGRPLDHPIFSPRFVKLQQELKERLQRVYSADHYVIQSMGGMTSAKQTKMAQAVHQQALTQVMTEFNAKLKSLRANRQASCAGLSCWDDDDDDEEDDADDDDDSCPGDEQEDLTPRFDATVRQRGQVQLLSCHPDDEQAPEDAECPLDESQQDGRNVQQQPTSSSGSRGLSPNDNVIKDIVLENLDPTNSMTDDDEDDNEEDDNVVVTEYSAAAAAQGKQQQEQVAVDNDDSEWDEYTIATTMEQESSSSRSLRNNVAGSNKVVLENQPSFLMTKSRMFSDFCPETQQPQQQQAVNNDDDDEYTEYTIQSSVFDTAAARGVPPTIVAASVAANKSDDDDDEWDEYTVQSIVAGSQQQAQAPSKAVRQEQERMMSSRMFSDFNPNNMDKNTSRQVVVLPQKQPDDDEYTEYTIQSAAQVSSSNARKTSTTTPVSKDTNNNDDDEWDEYTVQDSVAAPSVVEEAQAARQRQLQLLNRSRFAREQAAAAKAARGDSSSPRSSPRSIHKQPPAAVSSVPSRQEKDEEWEEYTVQDETVQSMTRPSARPAAVVVTSQQLDHYRNSRYTLFSSNNDSKNSSPASALSSSTPPPATPRVVIDIDEEWEEYTIQEETGATKKDYSPPDPVVDVVDTSAFGQSRMFSNFDPKSGSDNHQDDVDDEDDDDDDEGSTEQYIHCPGDASVVSAFTMEPGWHKQEEGLHNRRNQFCAPPKSPKSTSQGGTRTAPTCDASSADSSNNNNNNKATTTTRSVVSTSHCSATSGGGSSCNAATGSKRIAELLRRDIWSKNEKVVHKAMLELLQDAALGGPESCARIVRYGGPLAIMCAMEANPNHVDIQIAACGTMEQLAAPGNNIDVVNNNGRNVGVVTGEQPPHHGVTLGEVGAVQSIVTAMKADMDHVELQRVACSALVNLTHHGAMNDISLDGAVETVTNALTRHASDPTIQEMAFVTLGNLCMENMTRLQELSQVDGLAAMTTALQRPWKNPMEKQGAISTLSMLLRAQAECC